MGKKKKALIEKINSILGTTLELKRIPLAELERLHDAISAKVGTATQGLPIGQNIQGLLDAPLIQVLKKRLSKKKLEDLTLRDLVSTLQEGTEDKGLLGLGILPRLFGSRRRK